MIHKNRKVRALGLCSGGLDSILSALLLREQGVEIKWITFETPFFSSEKAKQASQSTGIPLIVQNITSTYLKMLLNPPCGYGRNMNPCMDCHALMFKIAGKIMRNEGFDFIFSGEVLGQRPMSQTKPSLRYVEKQSGCNGYILRPLSAACLPVTIPEEKELVDRKLLLGISGRSRKPQINLAAQLGVFDYPTPAGGCLLTDATYCVRLKDLFEHHDIYSVEDLNLLKYGRHFRIDKKTKIIVGRNKKDNFNILKSYDNCKDVVIKIKDYPGPTVIVSHGDNKDILTFAASVCVGYSNITNDKKVKIIISNGCNDSVIDVTGIAPEQVRDYII